jgi:sec-independent protein translocase protein TatA
VFWGNVANLRASFETTIQNFFDMTYTFLFIQNLNMTELLIILGVVLLLFGGKKIPELMRGVGKGIKEFNNARNSVEEELKEGMREYDKKKLEEKRAAE